MQAPTPQLYLALVAIRRGDDAAADAHLSRYLALGAPPRLAVHLERTRQALRAQYPLLALMVLYTLGGLWRLSQG